MARELRRAGARRLRPWAVGLPVVLLGVLELVRIKLLDPLLGSAGAADTTGALAIVAVLVCTLILWRMALGAEAEMATAFQAARTREDQLGALHQAALSVTGALDLPTVLQRVVQASRAVIGARYGAVAVLTAEGAIQEFVTSGVDAQTRERLGAPPTGHGLLGVVITERRPLLVDDIAAHERSVGFPPGHPPMTTLLAVPLLYKGSLLGSIYLSDRGDGQPFTTEDRGLLEHFGAQAAIAVANARLYGQLQRLSLVEERERISMDLHDGVLQTLYATGLGLEAAIDDIDADPAAARAAVERAIERLHSTVSDIRHYIFDLRAAQEEDSRGLPAMLRQLVDGLAHPGVEVHLDVDGASSGAILRKRVRWECWHIAREALSNALRHSGCATVRVEAATRGEVMRLRVADDGAGFDLASAAGADHRGLRNMRRRAESFGGSVEVRSVRGEGTVVTLSVPLEAGGGGAA